MYSNCYPCSGKMVSHPCAEFYGGYPGPSMVPAMPNRPLYPLPAIGGQLPTGLPTGPQMLPPPQIPQSELMEDTSTPGMAGTTGMAGMTGTAGMPQIGQAPETVTDINYTPGYLRTLIGQKIRVEFLIGSNAPLVDRTGTLLRVGASYILLQLENSDDTILCDLYSIKFVTVFG